MLNNYVLYKKLDNKLDKSINELKKENTKVYVRIIVPPSALYLNTLIPDSYMIVKILLLIIVVLLISWTFNSVKFFLTSFYEDILVWKFNIFGINTTLNTNELNSGKKIFKENKKEMYKTLHLIKSALENYDQSIELFLIFAEDELQEINQQLRLVKRIIGNETLENDSVYNEFNILCELLNQIIDDIDKKGVLKRSNKELYDRLFNLSICPI